VNKRTRSETMVGGLDLNYRPWGDEPHGLDVFGNSGGNFRVFVGVADIFAVNLGA